MVRSSVAALLLSAGLQAAVVVASILLPESRLVAVSNAWRRDHTAIGVCFEYAGWASSDRAFVWGDGLYYEPSPARQMAGYISAAEGRQIDLAQSANAFYRVASTVAGNSGLRWSGMLDYPILTGTNNAHFSIIYRERRLGWPFKRIITQQHVWIDAGDDLAYISRNDNRPTPFDLRQLSTAWDERLFPRPSLSNACWFILNCIAIGVPLVLWNGLWRLGLASSRRRKDLCTSCGHPLHAAKCSECGAMNEPASQSHIRKS
jgi:hypothetical protein